MLGPLLAACVGKVTCCVSYNLLLLDLAAVLNVSNGQVESSERMREQDGFCYLLRGSVVRKAIFSMLRPHRKVSTEKKTRLHFTQHSLPASIGSRVWLRECSICSSRW